MAASASRGSERQIHQDYIARIRYFNTLPPPPNPPKLLDVPNTGLSSGQYTAPGFASRLARDQSVNIEADAELGMPLDLVGMPGIFDGDESSIQAPLHTPPVHPHDRALLRSLASLGKPKSLDSGVSFLRRTEYISSHTSKSRFDSTTSRSLINYAATRVKKTPTNVNKESPEYIKEQVGKSFQVAAQYLQEPHKLKHPYKRNVKLIESFPVLPDLNPNTFPDAGGYVSIKFQTNPVPPANVYDIRLQSGVLRPLHPSDEEVAQREAALAAHERDPKRNPYPAIEQNYEFFLVDSVADAKNFKRKYDVTDPDKDDEDLYTYRNEANQKCFRFKRIRAYETAISHGTQETKYDEEIVIAINDGSDGIHKRAAYYYPLVQRSTIRPQRAKNIERQKYNLKDHEAEIETMVDILDVSIRDPTEEEEADRNVWVDSPCHIPEDIEEDGQATQKSGVQRDIEEHDQDDVDAQLQDEDMSP